MRKIIFTLSFFIYISCYSQFQLKMDSVYGNNVKSFFLNSGVFNHHLGTSNYPGFEWIKGSGKHAVYTSGINIAAYVNNQLKMAVASYKGEFVPGYSNNGRFYTNSIFRFYKIKRGDNYTTNPDWLNWGLMVQYGAPYVDVNNSGYYEYAIDVPGIKGAAQTLFICLTDGDSSQHKVGEGFGGGTLPIYSEVHFTVWCYDNPGYEDIQFLKWEIVNKSTYNWNKTYFSIHCDADLGYPDDDYMGSDSIRGLGYVYNADNNDDSALSQKGYGLNPPAVGIVSLNCIPKTLPVSSIITFFPSSSTPGPACEKEPNGEPLGAYNLMRGYKKDSTPWVVPNTNPPRITKFCYSGNPESNTGWTEYGGKIANCGGSLTGGYTFPNPPADRNFVISHGSDNLTINVNDTVRILAAQLIARGMNNLNSITKLKELSDRAKQLCQNGFVIGISPISNEIPQRFNLYQNYPNPFNPVTKIKFGLPENSIVTLTIYDALGREVESLVNDKLNLGVYSVDWDASAYPSGVYFYQLFAGKYNETRKMILLK